MSEPIISSPQEIKKALRGIKPIGGKMIISVTLPCLYGRYNVINQKGTYLTGLFYN